VQGEAERRRLVVAAEDWRTVAVELVSEYPVGADRHVVDLAWLDNERVCIVCSSSEWSERPEVAIAYPNGHPTPVPREPAPEMGVEPGQPAHVWEMLAAKYLIHDGERLWAFSGLRFYQVSWVDDAFVWTAVKARGFDDFVDWFASGHMFTYGMVKWCVRAGEVEVAAPPRGARAPIMQPYLVSVSERGCFELWRQRRRPEPDKQQYLLDATTVRRVGDAGEVLWEQDPLGHGYMDFPGYERVFENRDGSHALVITPGGGNLTPMYAAVVTRDAAFAVDYRALAKSVGLFGPYNGTWWGDDAVMEGLVLWLGETHEVVAPEWGWDGRLPAVSPDGTRLAFVREPEGGPRTVVVVARPE